MSKTFICFTEYGENLQRFVNIVTTSRDIVVSLCTEERCKEYEATEHRCTATAREKVFYLVNLREYDCRKDSHKLFTKYPFVHAGYHLEGEVAETKHHARIALEQEKYLHSHPLAQVIADMIDQKKVQTNHSFDINVRSSHMTGLTLMHAVTRDENTLQTVLKKLKDRTVCHHVVEDIENILRHQEQWGITAVDALRNRTELLMCVSRQQFEYAAHLQNCFQKMATSTRRYAH